MEKYDVSKPENRKERAAVLQKLMALGKSIEGFSGKSPKEVLAPENEVGRRELISTLSVEQYLQLISGVNGILRGKEKDEWVMDGVGVTAAGYEVRGSHIFPRHSEKREILAASWGAAQDMNAAGRDLEDIGMLLGSMLVETHPFADGNGRTSRLVYLVVKEGMVRQRMQMVLDEDGRFEFDMALTKVDIDLLFEKKYGRRNSELNTEGIDGILPDDELAFGQLQFPERVSEEVRDNIMQAGRNDEHVFRAAVIHFLHVHRELSVDSFAKEYRAGKMLLLQKLLARISGEQVEELQSTYWNLKKRYTEDMIDIFVNPDKPEYRSRYHAGEPRLIDVFKKRIADKVVLI